MMDFFIYPLFYLANETYFFEFSSSSIIFFDKICKLLKSIFGHSLKKRGCLFHFEFRF